MKNNDIYRFLHLLILAVFFFSCVESIDFGTESFESALIIDATISNEEKEQMVLLSRTYKFEEEGPNPEIGASVNVVSNGENYVFEEIEPGMYVSVNPFKAMPNVDYQLKIGTRDGRAYASSSTRLTQSAEMDELYLERESNDDGIAGISIYVDSFDPTNSSKYYRYEYEETYKIIAPNWVANDLIVTNPTWPFCSVELVKRPLNKKVCYNTVLSSDINLASTIGLTEDRVSKHLIRFIDDDNYIISHRYSILVRQFVQSKEAYAYYEALSKFSDDGNIFSQSQPGFFSGNVFSESNTSEKVVGFFDVSTVASQRIYFNYEDHYPDEALPPYASLCVPFAPLRFGNPCECCGGLISGINFEGYKYLRLNEGELNGGPYVMVINECGDCTSLGSSTVPDFWID